MAWTPTPDQAALGQRLMQEYGVHTDNLTDCSTCHR
jgi:cytochrome c peroxidase